MTADGMILELTTCYIPASGKMIEKMKALAESIPDDARQDVIDAIMEKEGPSTKIGTSHIVAACILLGISYRKTHYIPATDWICDGCGTEFKYSASPDDDDKIDKYMTDFCPNCGLQPYYTMLAQQYNALGIHTPWYPKLLDESAKWGKNTVSTSVRTRMGGQWAVGGIFWHRVKAEAERREQKRIEVDAKMFDMDRAKRWDLKGEL
jgi:hypothetical protein